MPSYLKIAISFFLAFIFVIVISISGDSGLWIFGGCFGLIGIFFLYLLIFQLKHIFLQRKLRIYSNDLPLKFLITLMGFLFIVGTLIYIFVFYTISHDKEIAQEVQHPIVFTNAEYILRSMVSSLDLFMLNIDSNILDRLDRYGALKGWLVFMAVISFTCTMALLFGLIFSRVRAIYQIHYKTKISNKRNHLYLFFGNNLPSELLIKDILKNDPKALTILIDEANVNELEGDELGKIVSYVTHNKHVFKKAHRIGAYAMVASQKLDDIDNSITERDDFDAFGYLGIAKIKKLLKRLSSTINPQLRIFFMDEDEELNIRNIITLAKDKTILSIAENNDIDHCIYCHARFNGPNRVVQDVAIKKSLNLKIIDSSHLAVEVLKVHPQFHPVNVVTLSENNPATVSSALNALIIGFGEVGRDAFRFLYEFGAFVDSNNINSRSPFICKIIDSNLDNIQGTFKSNMPGIFQKEAEDAAVKIEFHAIDINSENFYNKVLSESFVYDLNYIIISIGNNDEAIALAIRIFNKIRRSRKELSNLKILVRCTDDNKVEGIQKIADHYNYGYGLGKDNQPVIHIFGMPENTYRYDLIISDKLVNEGKLFHKKYNEISGEKETWEQRYQKLTATPVPDIEKLRKLRRQESQDMANALHSATKMIILGNALKYLAYKENTSLDWYSFYLRYFNPDGSVDVEGRGKNIFYPQLSDQENLIILHLAILEHIRWNAAHELMGYEFYERGKECDERIMRHNCLCNWDSLDVQSQMITDWDCDYKKYDFCVVDTTLALYKNRLLF